MNWRRVVLGGLLAALVMTLVWLPALFVLSEDIAAMTNSLGLSIEPMARAVLYGSIATPVLGLLSVWLYAAIRPRYGAGPTTSVIAGFVVWLVTFLVDTCWASLGIVSMRLFGIMKTIDLIAIVLATIVGAWLYQETETHR
jgi:uncharacterized PurR-regulated membrane protein YhhQ (DUF165 family)